MATLMVAPKIQFFDNNGVPLSGGKLYTYDAGTNDPRLTWTTSSQSVENTNPVILSSRGEANVFLSGVYRFILTDSDDSQIWEVDNIADLLNDIGSQLVTATGSTYARSLEDRFADVVTPKNWQDLVVAGDWEPAINAAIDACPEGGTVWLDGTRVIGDTLVVSTNNITIEGPAVLTAKAATNFEYMIYGTGLTGVTVKNLTLDANKANRSTGQSIRFMGACFVSSTDCGFVNTTVKNARGFGGISAVGLTLSACTRGFVDNCALIDCGDAGYDADGVFTSGTQNTISNSRASNCTDTAFVIENSSFSVISGCSSYGCAAAAAVTLASNDNHYGNSINGLTVRNWDAPSTGGIQIGTLSGTGSLYDTTLTGVTMYADTGAGYGSGAAIWVRMVGAGSAKGVDIVGLNINGTGYGVRVDDGENVAISGSIIKGCTSAAVYFASGVDHSVKSSHLQGGDYGILSANAAEVDAVGNTIKGSAVAGVAALNTSTINHMMNTFKSMGGLRTTKDAGATLNHMYMISDALAIGNIVAGAPSGALSKKAEIYNADDSTLAGEIGIYS